MKGQLAVATPEEYLAAVEPARRADIEALDALIRRTAPKLTPFIHSGMLAYGPTHYRYESGREGDWFQIGLASNKSYISLYICATDGEGYLAERYREALPKANIGKSCVRFRRLSDLDHKALTAMIRAAAKLWRPPGKAASTKTKGA